MELLFLAAILREHRQVILDRYATELISISQSISGSPEICELFLDDANRLLDDIIMVANGPDGFTDAPIADPPGSAIETTPLLDKLHPSDLAQTGTAFFRIAYETVSNYMLKSIKSETPFEIHALTSAALILNKCVIAHQRDILAAYGRRQLHHIQSTYADERRRLSRELHDRIGHSLGAATQNIDLSDMYFFRDPGTAHKKLVIARESLSGLLDNLRNIVLDLRIPVQSETLHLALRSYAGVAKPDGMAVDIAVNGDEAWMSPLHLDELFLIVREGMSNAFKHSYANTVTVRVDIIPHLTRAIVKDDGVGFSDVGKAANHTGLMSMHERAEILGGTIHIKSARGAGTSIEATIPLRVNERSAVRS